MQAPPSPPEPRADRFKYIRNLDTAPWGDGGGNGSWKQVLANEPDQTWDEPRPPEELFDLFLDPLERTNLAEDPSHQDILAEFRTLLVAHAEATEDFRATEIPVNPS